MSIIVHTVSNSNGRIGAYTYDTGPFLTFTLNSVTIIKLIALLFACLCAFLLVSSGSFP